MQAGVFKKTAPQAQKNLPTLKERAQKLLEELAVKETSTKVGDVGASQADEQTRQEMELHAKFKTNTHPLIGTYLNNGFKRNIYIARRCYYNRCVAQESQ